MTIVTSSALSGSSQNIKNEVPEPIYDGDQSLIELYYKAWEIADKRIMHTPGMPSERYMDEGCMDGFGPKTIWIWDTAFMSLFCKYAPQHFPGVESLRNFYEPVLDSRSCPLRIHHPDNPPLFAWVEHDYYKFTDDRQHLDSLILTKKYPQRYYQFFKTLDKNTVLSFDHQPVELKNMGIGFDWNGNPSGMDNTPRNSEGDILWVDAISQQALSALYISRMAELCSDKSTAESYSKEYKRLKDIINKYYWDDQDGCYYDIYQKDSSVTRILTPASFWPMMAEIPSQEQAERMTKFALAATRLGGDRPWKTVSADSPYYAADGGRYWLGAIWLPTAYMGIKSLEKYGLYDLANDTAEKLVNQINRTYINYSPHTIWEAYNPSGDTPANGKRKPVVRPDFCGWSALGPISLFIENLIGIYDVDAGQKVVRWNIHHEFRHGLKKLKFGDIATDLIYDAGRIEVNSNGDYTLYVNGREFSVKSGSNHFEIFDGYNYFNGLYTDAPMKFSFDKWQKKDFKKWQKEFRARLADKLGITRLQTRFKAHIPVVNMANDLEDCGTYTRQRGTIMTEPGVPLPFIILVPKELNDKAPLVLTLQGHSKNPELFAGVYTDETERYKGEVGERNIGVQAVEHGCIAIVPTTRAFGETRTMEDKKNDRLSSCNTYLKRDILVGRTVIGDRVWDVMKILDWALKELPVDKKAVVVTGNSGGGTTTLFAGAIDTRIQYTIPGSYFCTFNASIGNLYHCDCNYIPGILDLGELSDIAGLTAPRVFRAIHGVKDPMFPIEGTREAFKDLMKIYEASGFPQNCSLYEGPEGHRYYKDGIWPFLKSIQLLK